MADSDINKLPAYRLGVLETKVDRLQDDVKALDGRDTDLSERVSDIAERLTALYGRFIDFEKRSDARFDRLEDQQRSNFRILFRSILAIGGLILAAEAGLIEKLMSAVSPLFP